MYMYVLLTCAAITRCLSVKMQSTHFFRKKYSRLTLYQCEIKEILPAISVHFAQLQSRHRQYLLCPFKALTFKLDFEEN